MRRTWLSVTLAILAAVTTLLATVGWWVHRTVMDTDRFMAVVEPVLESEAVGEAVGERVTEELFTAVGFEQLVTESMDDVDDWLGTGLGDLLGVDPDGPVGRLLPDDPGLGELAPTLVEAARQRVEEQVAVAVETPRFQAALGRSVRTAHTAAVALLRREPNAVPGESVVDGDVTLDLRPLVEAALGPVVRDTAAVLGLDPEGVPEDLRLGDLAERLGRAAGLDVSSVVVVSRDQLAPWRDAVATLDRLAWALVALAFVLAVGAILAAPSRSRGAIGLGVGLVVAMALTIPLLDLLERNLVAQAESTGARETVAAMVEVAAADLRWAAATVAATALVIVLGAWTLGRRRRAP